MRNNPGLEELTETVRGLMRDDRYDDALELIAKIEETAELSPTLLVLKGVAIQMGPELQPDGLGVAEAAFRKAVSIDERYVEGLLELAWLLFAVLDKAGEAKPLFERALTISRSQAIEAALGIAKCLFEIDGKAAALQFLRDCEKQALRTEDITKIAELREEIEQSAE